MPAARVRTPRHPRRQLLVRAAGALVVVGLTACGSDGDAVSGDRASTSSTGGGTDDYGNTADDDTPPGTRIEARDFELTSITVAPDSSVTVENTGSATHTVTADDGTFDSGKVAGGASGSLTAPTAPGEYPFHCVIHPSMTGTLTVAG